MTQYKSSLGKWKSWLLIILVILINGIVLYNAILHNPRTGYDAQAHTMYMGVLSDGHLPTSEQTYEFFRLLYLT